MCEREGGGGRTLTLVLGQVSEDNPEVGIGNLLKGNSQLQGENNLIRGRGGLGQSS